MIGHNDRIAWGFTTTASDVEDLFIEKLDPTDPGRYLTPQGSAPFETRQETIAVRDAAPVDADDPQHAPRPGAVGYVAGGDGGARLRAGARRHLPHR